MRFLWATVVALAGPGCFSKPPDLTSGGTIDAPGDGRADAQVDARIDGPPLVACDWMNFDDDLVMYLSMNESAGVLADDQSTNMLDGTLIGATFATGRIGNAVNFDGTGSRISVGSQGALDNLTQISACAWVRLDDIPGDGAATIVDKSANGYLLGWNMYFETLPDHRFGFLSSGGDYVSGSQSWTTNQWMHVCATWNGMLGPQTITLYRDGVLDNHGREADMDLTARQDDSDQPLVLGRQSTMSSFFLEGLIDEFFLFERVLTPEEVNSLWRCAP